MRKTSTGTWTTTTLRGIVMPEDKKKSYSRESEMYAAQAAKQAEKDQAEAEKVASETARLGEIARR